MSAKTILSAVLVSSLLAISAAHNAEAASGGAQRNAAIRQAQKNPTSRYTRAGTAKTTVSSPKRVAAAPKAVGTGRKTRLAGYRQPMPQEGEIIVESPEGTIVEGDFGHMDGGDCGGCGECSDCGDCGGCGYCADCVKCLIPIGYDPWVRAEYLAWWTKGADYPVLVTTSPDGTAQNIAGVLGQPTTTTLFGGESYNSDIRSGYRISMGEWLGPCRQFGIEGSYFNLGEVTTSFADSSLNRQIIARPFYNVSLPGEDAQLVAYTNPAAGPAVSGNIAVDITTELIGGELMARRSVIRGCGRNLDVLAGWRYGRLKDSMLVTESITSVDGSEFGPIGATLDVFDLFETTNDFNGFQFGFEAEWEHCRWTLEIIAKLALGNTRSVVEIDGQTVTTVNAAAASTAAGLLALPSNMGRHERDSFSVMPELGVNLHYDLTCRLRMSVGYTFIYWSQVARPGEQIDTDLNLTQIPPGPLVGAARPEFNFDLVDFWAQGITAGIEYRF